MLEDGEEEAAHGFFFGVFFVSHVALCADVDACHRVEFLGSVLEVLALFEPHVLAAGEDDGVVAGEVEGAGGGAEEAEGVF